MLKRKKPKAQSATPPPVSPATSSTAKKKKAKKGKKAQRVISFWLIVLFLAFVAFQGYFYEDKLVYTVFVSDVYGVVEHVYEPETHYWIWQKIIPYTTKSFAYAGDKRVFTLSFDRELPSADVYGDFAQSYLRRKLFLSAEDTSAFLKPSFAFHLEFSTNVKLKINDLWQLYEKNILPEDLDGWLDDKAAEVKNLLAAYVASNVDFTTDELDSSYWETVQDDLNAELNFVYVENLSPTKITRPDIDLYNFIKGKLMNDDLDSADNSAKSDATTLQRYKDLGILLNDYPSLTEPLVLSAMLDDISNEQ